ncbi:MAG: TrkH family potassium uptake protein, partial [Butyricicoccus sp.]|nr:TrkH family potassium uptake protein [Butyricicoccus sp.]
MKSLQDRMTPTKIIVLGYLSIILVGAVLLSLPIACKERIYTPFLDALFTATSATCVTGLIVYDTATYWSLFGQAVILTLIQIGGLGFITMAMALATLSKRRIGLKSRFVMQESIAAPQMGGIIRLARFVFTITVCVELCGAALLSIRFIPLFGFAKGLWYGVFHAISAFCNAGFDLMGTYSGPLSSLTAFTDDPIVTLSVMLLIVFGGVGFFVWENLWMNRRDKRHFSLQTKIVLLTTAVLIFVPAALMLVFQNGQMQPGLPRPVQGLAALFQSVTTRTAGFNSVGLGDLASNSQLLMVALMLIGGSPGSTAGGMKTTTAVVLMLCLRSTLRREDELQCFGRRIHPSVLKNAVTIATSYMGLTLIGTMALCHFDQVPLMSSLFETASAIATVGLTLGITPDLGGASHLILIFLMFFGRVGCMTMLY